MFLGLVSIAIVVLIHPFSGSMYLDTLTALGEQKSAENVLTVILSSEIENHMTVEDYIIRELVYGERLNTSEIIEHKMREFFPEFHFSFKAVYNPAPGIERILTSGEYSVNYDARVFIATPLDMSKFQENKSALMNRIEENATLILKKGDLTYQELEIFLQPYLRKAVTDLCYTLNLTNCTADFSPLISALYESKDPEDIEKFINMEFNPGFIEIRLSIWR